MRTRAALLALACLVLAACADDEAAAHTLGPTATSIALVATIEPTPTATSTPTAMPTSSATPTPSHTPRPAAPPVVPAPQATQPAPAVGTPVRVVDRGPADRRAVALTFDAGSDAGYTSQILDTLRQRGVHVSFGMTGAWAEQNPELLRRIVAEGHHLINHTDNHDSFTGVSAGRGPQSREARHAQLRRTEDVVRRIAGVEIGPYFRPPYGDYDASVNADVGMAGYRYNVMWTVDSLGWRGLPLAGIVERCLSRATPGAIYIFHVGSQAQDGPALPAILDGLAAQGYEFVTVAQLLER